jgi:hypothetical protein
MIEIANTTATTQKRMKRIIAISSGSGPFSFGHSQSIPYTAGASFRAH